MLGIEIFLKSFEIRLEKKPISSLVKKIFFFNGQAFGSLDR